MPEPTDPIDEQARRQFESDWKSQKLNPIESYLPDPGDALYLPTLEELLHIDLEFSWKAYEKKTSSGPLTPAETPTARLKSLASRLNVDQMPDLMERLLAFDRELAHKSGNRNAAGQPPGQADQIGLDTVSLGETPLSPKTDSPALDDVNNQREFGNYRLLERLGRGGMGIVFRAEEKKTGRQVALKMIRSNIVHRVDEETRRIVLDRFQNEARAVANIQHPNIVTLFEVGEHDQTPYISMQLVNGEDLSNHIRRSTLSGREAAEVIKPVAEAIAAAHKKQIIHRDLKPHNILVDSNTGKPLVTDFGLAKLADDGSEEGLTETGELLGTPGYMSPEQASGKPVTASTDIYSLGATLYCLISGRAPFQASDTLKTIEQILRNPPVSPIEIRPDIDVDLNTICLKCLEKDPSRRYDTADSLARELDRYLQGIPIQARPIGKVERSVRWCRRNPLPTTVFASILLLLLITCGAFFQSIRLNQIIGEKATLNQQNATIAFRSNREEITRISEDLSLQLPGMLDTRKNLLDPLRTFFGEFIELNGEAPEVRKEFAFAHYALGSVAHELGDFELSIDYLTAAMDLYRQSLDLSPDNPVAQLDLSNCHNLRAECHLKTDRPGESLNDFKIAFEIRRALVEKHPKNPEYLRKLANVEMNLGNWFSDQGEIEATELAMAHYESSNLHRQPLFDEESLPPGLGFRLRYDRAKCLFNRARAIDLLRRLQIHESNTESSEWIADPEAIRLARKSLLYFQVLHEEKPKYLTIAADLARCGQLLAELDPENRLSLLKEAVQAFDDVVALYPSEKKHRWSAARSLLLLGDALLRERSADAMNEAETVFRTALNRIDGEPVTGSDQKFVKIRICTLLALVLHKGQRTDEAAAMILNARKLLESVEDKTTQDYLLFNGMIESLEKSLQNRI